MRGTAYSVGDYNQEKLSLQRIKQNEMNFFTSIRPNIGILLALLAGVALACSSCNRNSGPAPYQAFPTTDAFVERVFTDTTDFYHITPHTRQSISSELPIGVFDSGTGGLTVLDALLGFDHFDLSKGAYHEAGDGLRDFAGEQFIYFGDQANMPYGNYPSMGKTTFLEELILRDALFLLGGNYYLNPGDDHWQTGKPPVKMIVIACNTATAYGKEKIEGMLSQAGIPVKVTGVIDAGVKGALACFGKEESGTVAVMATAGTVSSCGYVSGFHHHRELLGYTGEFDIIQQAGYGIAEAIDEEPGFINRQATRVREQYQGPSFRNPDWQISRDLMPVYNFNMEGNALLLEKEGDEWTSIQLNSAENYIRYHLVHLCEQLKNKPVSQPLKVLVLGCTHYPFQVSAFRSILQELRELKSNGEFVYRHLLGDTITLVDPAVNTAREVHAWLMENGLINTRPPAPAHQFYISIPDSGNQSADLDPYGNFEYAYKYSRNVNQPYDTRPVPMGKKTVQPDILIRLERQLPEIYGMIRAFETYSDSLEATR